MKVLIKSITTKKIVEYVADFARVSRDRDEAPTTQQKDMERCKQLWRNEEGTAFECINIDFLVSEVSRSLLAQITRYRHATFMVLSQRYVKMGIDDEFIFPDFSYIKNPDAIQGCYDLCNGTAKHIKANYNNLILLGAKPEDARAILLNATPTRFRIVCNLRSFLHFYKQRSDAHAQKEIRTLAGEMLCQLYKKIDDESHSFLAFVEESYAHTGKHLYKDVQRLYEFIKNNGTVTTNDLLKIVSEYQEYM
jgi:thymidylate synthase (FAD)